MQAQGANLGQQRAEQMSQLQAEATKQHFLSTGMSQLGQVGSTNVQDRSGMAYANMQSDNYQLRDTTFDNLRNKFTRKR